MIRPPFAFPAQAATRVAVLALALAGCAPTPSQQPLGVGPLPPGAKLAAELRKEARAKKTARGGPPAPSRDAKTEVTVETEEKPERPSPSPAPPVAKADRPAPSSTRQEGAATIADPTGDYRGDDVSAYKLSGLPDRTEKDPNARVNVRKSADRTYDFTLVDSSNGKDICTLSGSLEGRTATIHGGQSCFEQDTGAASATATVTRGTATFENARLVLDLTLDFELRLGDDEHTGTLEYHFDGTRR